MNRTIFLSDVEPAQLSLRHPLGVDLDLRVKMRTQQDNAVDPTLAQFVLIPRSTGSIQPYDMEAFDVANGIARIALPGSALADRNGYNIELYLREANEVPEDPSKPVGLAARGTLVTEGVAYSSPGPLSMINVPVVIGPPGPTGATGAQGEVGETGPRGSMWFTGPGAPTDSGGYLVGDMWLDETNGDVWRYDGEVWTRGTF